MLLAENVTLDFTKQPLVIPGTEGTGVYRHLKGNVTVTSLPHTQNADLVITLHR